MRFLINISRTKMPFRFRKRIKARNSKTRTQVSGFANFERHWICGFDVIFEWGNFDPSKPDAVRQLRALRRT